MALSARSADAIPIYCGEYGESELLDSSSSGENDDISETPDLPAPSGALSLVDATVVDSALHILPSVPTFLPELEEGDGSDEL